VQPALSEWCGAGYKKFWPALTGSEQIIVTIIRWHAIQTA